MRCSFDRLNGDHVGSKRFAWVPRLYKTGSRGDFSTSTLVHVSTISVQNWFVWKPHLCQTDGGVGRRMERSNDAKCPLSVGMLTSRATSLRISHSRASSELHAPTRVLLSITYALL